MSNRVPTDGGSTLAHRPFAGLGGRASATGGGATQSPPVSPVPVLAPWAVVRLERKGRGGKEVTVIEKLELRPKELEAWAKELKQQLGCGGLVEGKTIALQGDQRERAAAWLEGRVKKVTRG
jgi:translation initiation factor 1